MRIKVFVFIIAVLLILVSCKSLSSNLNIVNGNFLSDEDYPTVVAIWEEGNNQGDGCSSIIVSENVILTAAHCFFLAEDLKNLGTNVGNRFIKGSSYIYLDEYRKREIEGDNLADEQWNIGLLYVDGKITKSEYESKSQILVEKYEDSTPYDLAVIIFDNIDGVAPFKSIIEKAEERGEFFKLSKNSFQNGTTFKDDKNSIFFLGFGFSGEYGKLRSVIHEEGAEYTGKKQIGYNSFIYNKNGNEWHSPKVVNGRLDKSLFEGSNIHFGDSGGPLVYKNQILGVASYFYPYDCTGQICDRWGYCSDEYLGKQKDGTFLANERCDNDSCCQKIKYASSRYASITLGNESKIAESFIKKVRDELDRKGLLNSNSIFKELLEN